MACADPDLCNQICGNSVGCSDIAYAKLVMELLPSGKIHFPLRNDRRLNGSHANMYVNVSRPAGSDDGRDDRSPHVIANFNL